MTIQSAPSLGWVGFQQCVMKNDFKLYLKFFYAPILTQISAQAHVRAQKYAHTLTVWLQSNLPVCRFNNLLSMCGESKQDIVLLSDANKLEASLIPGVPSPELRFGLGFNVYYVVLHLGP